jgi:hypothetical protein
MEDNYVFFWQTKSPFSNWHPSKFTFVEISYHNMEQFMMRAKAVLMGDMETADKIMAITDPRAIKALGREVKNFNSNLWDKHKFDIVFNGCKAKFTQNEKLKKALMETGDKTLVEASPYDKVWGIGLDEATARKTDPNKWPGENILGKVLTKLRDSLKNS